MLRDHLSTTFSALADPTRRAILARLAAGETSVAVLAAPFEMTAPAITKHLKVLEQAGLITRSRQAQWRPCQLNAAPLQEAADFIEQYRQFWEQSFDRLDAYLKTMQSPPITQKTPTAKKLSSIYKERKNGRKKR